MTDKIYITSITHNERRTEIYMKGEDERYYTIDLINNKINFHKQKNGEWVVKEAKQYECNLISNTAHEIQNLLFHSPDTEFWLVAYFDMLHTAMLVNPSGYYSNKKYEMFRRIFGTHDFYQWPTSCFKSFSPVVEKIAKQGFVVKERDLIVNTMKNNDDSIFNMKINLNSYRKNYTEIVSGKDRNTYVQKISISDYIEAKKFFMKYPELQALTVAVKDYAPDLEEYYYERFITNNSDFFSIMIKTYNYDCKRLIKYLFEDLKWQGIKIASVSSARYDYNTRQIFTLVEDYARMSFALKGNRNFDKYPRTLKTSHDIVAMNYNAMKDEKKVDIFKTVVSDKEYIKFKSWEDKKKLWVVVTPTVPNDLVDEGTQQHHCVASYVDNVIDRTSIILFFRKKEEPEESVLTVEIKNGEIYQVKGLMNRSPDANEKAMMQEFAIKFNLIYDNNY